MSMERDFLFHLNSVEPAKFISKLPSASLFLNLSNRLPKALRSKYFDDPLVKSFDGYKMTADRSVNSLKKGSNFE